MKKTIIILFFLVPIVSFSQNDSTAISKKDQRKIIPAYIEITAGISSSSFRDFATSPLVYNGSPLFLSLSYLKADDKRESEIGLSYSTGKYTYKYYLSQVKTISLSYSKLFMVQKLSSEKLNLKLGGLLISTYNLRHNQYFINNDIGSEIFTNLMGSVKLTKDISRNEIKSHKFLFLKYKSNPRIRQLSYMMNVGLVNSTYRNGYAYTNQSKVLNDYNRFDNYQFKLFSGFRISSELNYTVFMKNKNAIQISYLWDAYKTGGELDKFEMAHHTFKLSLLFNTNNK